MYTVRTWTKNRGEWTSEFDTFDSESMAIEFVRIRCKHLMEKVKLDSIRDYAFEMYKLVPCAQ